VSSLVETVSGTKLLELLAHSRNRTLEVWGSIPHGSTENCKGFAAMRGPFGSAASGDTQNRPVVHDLRELPRMIRPVALGDLVEFGVSL